MKEKILSSINQSDDEILFWGQGIRQTLLVDRTTERIIFWTIDDYFDRGEGYSFYNNINLK